MKRPARSMYRKIYWLPLLGIFLLILIGLMIVGSSSSRPPEPFIAFCSVLFFGWLIAGRWISYWLVPLFVATIKCPGCSEEMNTVAVWDCSCGFHDHKERNILTKLCPIDLFLAIEPLPFCLRK